MTRTEFVAHLASDLPLHPGFDALQWVEDWLAVPLPALGGRIPNEQLDTEEGREQVVNLFHRIQSGAYA